MNKKIIIAEDSSVIQNLTRKILSQLNFDIIAVKNGKEVLAQMESNTIDLILLDINMPIMNGIECAKAIREGNNQSDTPLIAITGNANNYSLDDFHEVGINEYLPKPLNFDLLVDTVKKYTNVN